MASTLQTYSLGSDGRNAPTAVSRQPGSCLRKRFAWVAFATLSSWLATYPVSEVLGQEASAPTASDSVTLSLSDARALALRQSPDLVAARLDTVIAQGELRQAGLLLRFNPEADVLGAGGEEGVEVEVAQEVEVFGQQSTRRGAARNGLERARAATRNATRLTLGELDRAFYRLVAATRRRDLANEVLGLNRRLAGVAGRQLQEGEIGRLDFNLASIELGRSRARLLSARRALIESTLELGRILGLPPSTRLIPVIDSTLSVSTMDSSAALSAAMSEKVGTATPLQLNADSLTQLALVARPDLAEREAAMRQAGALATLAGREALPNLVLRGTSQREGGTDRVLRPGIGLTLPLFNRNRGEVGARRAASQQARLERAALGARVRAEVAAVIAGYEAATTEVALLEATVLQPARQNRQLVEIAYREGKVGLAELLLIRNQAIDAELDYWEAWLSAREALATMAEVTSQNLPADNAGGGQ